MVYDSQKHHRRSIRLKGYDYTQPGAYFVTIVTKDRVCLFGQVVEGQMRLNAVGHIAQQCWTDIPNHFPHVELDAFIIMPNHVHGILVITDVGARHAVPPDVDVGARHAVPLPTVPLPTAPPPTVPQPPTVSIHPTVEQFGKPVHGSIPTIVRSFKSAATRYINILRGTPGAPVWQRNYYEHIIRNEDALNRIREYIATNPLRWQLDRENPDRTGRNPDEEMWFGTI
ncbi:MAG: hypothetical protein KatS3mg038_2942 [Candidatus Kapaibacterium sp.]|nr:MAG: hypothetical protein KatS3mg038_2942 [Candidatus Kapabacteria bacterium]